ncbi:MAG: VWA domain-containing protein [Methylococcales bacterium]|jgi:Ca-activated chloride channel homolog|nr:VWA domain-containing protein [Methylococcales bacterium]MBT7410025.1 VWA domain-containing protein [Methylococcales bacterium]
MIENFTLLRPYWLLALIPVALLIVFLLNIKKQHNWKQVCDQALLPFIIIDQNIKQSVFPILILLFCSLLVILALAGPVWEKIPQPVFKKQSAVIILLDLSASMDADDIKPSRLIHAKRKIIDLLKLRKEGQTALIAYAGQAYVVSPLTDDIKTITALIPSLTTDIMPNQGSRADKALLKAMDMLKQTAISNAQILIITDGIRTGDYKAVDLLVKHSHQVSILAVGTENGAPIKQSQGDYLKDRNGSIIIPKLSMKDLQKLASTGRGLFVVSQINDQDIERLIPQLNHTQLNAENKKTSFVSDEWKEKGAWLILLLIPFAAYSFRKGVLFSLFIVSIGFKPMPVYAINWDDLWLNKDQQGLQAFKSKEMEKATDLFNDPEWKAAAQYKNKQYEQSLKSLENINSAESNYNKANALVKLNRLQEAMASYQKSLKLDPDHEDAKHNLNEVKKFLEKQAKQKQKSQSEKNGKNKKKGNKKKDPTSKNESKKSSSKDKNKSSKQQEQSKKQQQKKQQAQNNKQQQKSEKNEDKKRQQASSQKKQSDQEKQQAQKNKTQKKKPMPQGELSEKQKEQKMAHEQWLRKIPEDPGALLRRKFLYQYQQQAEQQDDNENPW